MVNYTELQIINYKFKLILKYSLNFLRIGLSKQFRELNRLVYQTWLQL